MAFFLSQQQESIMAKVMVSLGDIYSQLTVISEILPRGKGTRWLCTCSCGTSVAVFGTNLRSNVTKSCGCLRKKATKQRFTKHGESSTPLYRVHRAMLARCNKQNNPAYKYYGGRGIKVCVEWDNYSVFKDWAINSGYTEQLTLERNNTDLGYYPDNCCWATRERQARNRRAQVGKTSKYIGVSWDKTRKKWMVNIGVAGKNINLGGYSSEEDAAITRDSYIKENNLDHFKLNF